MRNLAGSTTAHANAYIEDELTEACIPVYPTTLSKGEVPASLVGEYKGFRFERVWTYWVVNGIVPLPLAQELYDDARGRYDVRVSGHYGCPEPVEWVMHVNGIDCVTLYHIDTQDGLNLFAEKVLGTRPLPPTEEEQEAALEIARSNRYGTIIYEDDPTEKDMLDAQKEVREIRSALSDLRSRLHKLSRGADKGMIPTDSIAHTVACTLTAALVTLYGLESGEDRSFVARAKRIKKRLDDLYANPTHYVLEKRNG